MPISYPAILDLKSEGQAFAWTDRETMLYALGVGMGADPMDERELPFVYENGLKAVPTLATVVAWGAGPGVGRMGINFLMVVHGEQAVTFHRPMPTEASILADSRVIGAWDKGPGKGAVIATETVLRTPPPASRSPPWSRRPSPAATAASAARPTASPNPTPFRNAPRTCRSTSRPGPTRP